MATTTWRIVLEPEGLNPGANVVAEGDGEQGTLEQGTNEGGMVVYLVGDGVSKREVSRVAWVRANATKEENRAVSFADQLDLVIERARTALKAMEALFAEAGELS